MRRLQTVIFDFDDTLVYTYKLFLEATYEFMDAMKKMGLYDDELFKVLDDFDIKNIEKNGGFLPENFPDAMRQTYRYYCNKYKHRPDVIVEESLQKIGWGVFEKEHELLPDAESLLEELKRSHALFLLTQGHKETQLKKIATSGLAVYFEQIKVVQQKNIQTYQGLIKDFELIPKDTWMIGNSIKSDINPANACGINCILLNATASWDFDKDILKADCFVAKNLAECKYIITKGG
ncbi:MAG: HAD family hydrolase [Clostridia bacterium]|mgnify:CR=1 FL=1|jgi:putative hydrolase of the HAD superfamily|nr:HAD family hydrolase [Clostridia bacterium]